MSLRSRDMLRPGATLPVSFVWCPWPKSTGKWIWAEVSADAVANTKSAAAFIFNNNIILF